jgi:PLP dependent protein
MGISENINNIRNRIESAALKAGCNPENIKLLAVTKTQNSVTIDEAIKTGTYYIAENRIQEAETKLPNLKETYKEFHFIGHLQSNKIPKLMALKPDLIHSIEKLSTAKKLNEYLISKNIFQNILIQVNTSGEASKSGVAPDEAIDLIKEVSLLSNINILGLMTIGMFTNDKQIIHKCFRTLREIFEQTKTQKIPGIQMKYLSMGMTGDFEIAIEEGANILRIGSAIFGKRY